MTYNVFGGTLNPTLLLSPVCYIVLYPVPRSLQQHARRKEGAWGSPPKLSSCPQTNFLTFLLHLGLMYSQNVAGSCINK